MNERTIEQSNSICHYDIFIKKKRKYLFRLGSKNYLEEQPKIFLKKECERTNKDKMK